MLDLQVYIHKNSYPSDLFNEHDYALGDIPEHVLRAMYQNYYMYYNDSFYNTTTEQQRNKARRQHNLPG